MTTTLAELRTCTKCSISKLSTEFYKQSSKNGSLHSWCRDCCREKQRSYWHSNEGRAKAEQRKLQGKSAEATRKYRYGLTQKDIEQMLSLQNYCCAICSDPMSIKEAHVDHDHSCCPDRKKTCGQCVRSLLCKSCNLMLGYAQDETSRLLSAAAYLIKMQESKPC